MKRLIKHYLKHIAFIIILFSLINYNVHSQIISTIAGNGSEIYNGDNILATEAQFKPEAIATDRLGNIFISDLNDSRVRKIDQNGIITTVAGNGVRGFSGDGGLATNATLNYNWGIALDSALNLYIVDDGESRIRKVTTDGIIITIAGIDTVIGGGYNGDSILAINARFNHPSYVAIDNIGNLYISDQGRRIRKIDTTGIITTIAGTGVSGYSGDGGLAINARIGNPHGIVADNRGNVYFTDIDTNIIRKVDKDGIITTIAGTGFAGYTGDGGPAKLATLNFPVAIAMSNDGILYIADANNHAVRKIDAMGIITTVIGDGSPGFSGDGGLAQNAKLNFPAAVTFDNVGSLLIADYGNARIRKVFQAVLPITLAHFDATNNNNKIEIKWQTSNELNADYFKVQRSNNGYSFSTIGKVSSVGNRNIINNYHFTDDKINAEDKILYYRLQSVDKNGLSNYSKTVIIKLKNLDPVIIYPNPVKNVLNIKISSSKKEAVMIQIIDLQGKVVQQFNVQLLTGDNSINVNVSGLTKGSHVIKIKGEEKHYKQFIKP